MCRLSYVSESMDGVLNELVAWADITGVANVR